MTADQAETYALRALVWILGDDDMTARFMSMSGADADALRRGAAEPEMLCAVMDFVLAEDRTVVDFAQSAGIAPENVAMILNSLRGGEQFHWT